jgi:hypothetical protein
MSKQIEFTGEVKVEPNAIEAFRRLMKIDLDRGFSIRQNDGEMLGQPIIVYPPEEKDGDITFVRLSQVKSLLFEKDAYTQRIELDYKSLLKERNQLEEKYRILEDRYAALVRKEYENFGKVKKISFAPLEPESSALMHDQTDANVCQTGGDDD